MAVKDLLLQLDDSAACAARVEAAIDLAVRHGAHLAGLCLVPEFVPASFAHGYLVPEVEATIARHVEERAAAIAARFEAAARRHNVPVESRRLQGHASAFVELIGRQARYADLVIMGQADPDQAIPGGELAEQVMMTCGRPVLLVPISARRPGSGGGCWSAGTPAARRRARCMTLCRCWPRPSR
jgi:nucleotide-binding universal stress UspA family protein